MSVRNFATAVARAARPQSCRRLSAPVQASQTCPLFPKSRATVTRLTGGESLREWTRSASPEAGHPQDQRVYRASTWRFESSLGTMTGNVGKCGRSTSAVAAASGSRGRDRRQRIPPSIPALPGNSPDDSMESVRFVQSRSPDCAVLMPSGVLRLQQRRRRTILARWDNGFLYRGKGLR